MYYYIIRALCRVAVTHASAFFKQVLAISKWEKKIELITLTKTKQQINNNINIIIIIKTTLCFIIHFFFFFSFFLYIYNNNTVGRQLRS